MLVVALASVALADEPACPGPFVAPAGALSVAWISPLPRRVGNRAWLEVVPTAQVEAWLKANPGTGVGRLLQRLGERKRSTEPSRPYKVTVFDVTPDELCRPLDGTTATVDGVAACEGDVGHATAHYTGCGYTTDRADGKRGFDVYRIEWRDAAARGFCVMPATRFVSEAGSHAP